MAAQNVRSLIKNMYTDLYERKVTKMEITLTKTNFDSEVLSSDKPVLVDFWASWCGPCKMLSPIIESLATEYEGKVKVGKVNVDDEGLLAAEYGIVSIPTVIVFKDGKIVEKIVGANPQDYYEDILDKYL